MSTLLMADTTDHSAPPGYDLYAGYIDGAYQSFPYLNALYPSRVVSISVFATDPSGKALDVEKGDATPAQAPGWVKSQGKTCFRIWVADYGVPHCPYIGASAWQKQDVGPNGENIDVSEIYDPNFGFDGVPIIYCPFSELDAVLQACADAGLTLVTPQGGSVEPWNADQVKALIDAAGVTEIQVGNIQGVIAAWNADNISGQIDGLTKNVAALAQSVSSLAASVKQGNGTVDVDALAASLAHKLGAVLGQA